MRIQILGTAASEGWPGLFCGCKTCTLARESGGKNFRSRSSIQIDNIYKIDFPPDTYYHSIRFGLDLYKLKYLFFTHSHGDHFAKQEIEYTRPGFAFDMVNTPIKIYASPAVFSALKSTLAQHKDMPIELHHAEPYIPIKADHLVFTPITAKHSKTQLCFNYIVQSDSATFLYASDTGLYDKDTMDIISDYKFDLIISECTHGAKRSSNETHMSLGGVLELRNKLQRAGAVNSNTRTVITHFSHNMGMLHEELEAIANPQGVEVAYDGMIIEV